MYLLISPQQLLVKFVRKSVGSVCASNDATWTAWTLFGFILYITLCCIDNYCLPNVRKPY